MAHEPPAVLLPVKSFRRAKERLAPALDATARAALAREMAETVRAAAGPLPVAVVCDDAEVAEWARRASATVIWRPGRGLNGAVADGVGLLAERGYGRVLVAHADLPLADDLGRVAEDLNRLQQQQLSEKEKEELRRRLQELRELIRQQGQGGKKLRDRLQRFMRRARGGMRPGSGRGQRGGKQGSGKPGQAGKGLRPGGLMIGPGGAPIPMDMPGSGAGAGQKPGGAGSGVKQ